MKWKLRLKPNPKKRRDNMGVLNNYVKQCGVKKAAGIKAILYSVPCCDLDGFPKTVFELTPSSTDPLKYITIGEAFAMESGKKFKHIGIVVDKGSIKSDKIGEDDAIAFDNSISFRISGDTPEELAIFEGICTNCGVHVVETTNGHRYVVGTTLRPAKVESASFDSGAALTDPSGTDYVLKASNVTPILYYPAALAMVIDE
ncbi:MAG: hypothetical protein LCH44_13945 [Bacteroidetes bacterium]|nr:hypothetical protein [Bacteroidota bacterium]